MINKRTDKLFLCAKLCVFYLIAAVALPAQAEFYSVYATPAPSELCIFCQTKTKVVHHTSHHKVKKHQVAHHHYHRKIGLYVSYPHGLRTACPCNEVWTLNYCQCCPQAGRVRSEWGDYVVFSSKPSDPYRHTSADEGNSFDPDLGTRDDGHPEMEVN